MADSIDRQAAIDEIDEWIKAFRENGHKESAADACLIQDGIIQLPSVDAVEVRHGRWLPDNNTYERMYHVCSVCKKATQIPRYVGGFLYEFCPSCGARMDGEQNEC